MARQQGGGEAAEGPADAPCCAGVRDNVAANRLLVVRARIAGAIDLRHDLVGDDDGDSKLVGQAHQAAQELGQMALPRAQLAAARKVGAVERRERVDDEQREARLGHHGGGLQQQLLLVVGIVRPRVRHVVQHLLAVEAEALRHCQQTHGTLREARRQQRELWAPVSRAAHESALRVDEETLALAAAHVYWQLCAHVSHAAPSCATSRPCPPGLTWHVTASVWHSWLLPVRNSP
ncbi:hypothetical protein FA09DRAFT_64151 [Tilletiopsis washingtonensis]|uniref:Uncharacterized protein n=1 Tax=Tilletiopsis washingtonensis TaxID=58919 RepID=A0A316Z7F0_9BASI|nr:hypothetical protein FA09DRAFT_64151 [Tilletiopsis washingtonensis]PWN97186.1 hypothetical protein FA09DRAFT_64151 [Tilletiopsis washingtonensis]